MTNEERLSSLEAKFEAFMVSHEDFKTEMRDRDNQRAAEIREIRQDIKEINQRFYTKFDEMDSKIDRLGDKIQTLVVAAVAGFGAIIIAVVAAVK